MSSVQGFTGGSTLHCSSSGIGLLRSAVFKDIKSFVEFSDEIPFAKPIPRGNSISLRRNSISLEIDELDSRGLHIPRWLPRFPDESSYKNCGERWEKREGGLALWENSDLVIGGGVNKSQGISRENEKRSDGYGDLSVERGKVSFKIGEAMKAQKGRILISFL